MLLTENYEGYYRASYLPNIELSTRTCYRFAYSSIVYAMDYFQITAVVEAWQAPTFVPIGDKSNVSGSVQTNHSYILPFKLLH